MKNLRKITVREDQRIGNGCYSTVFKISESLIVKAFGYNNNYSFSELLAADEIHGSKVYNNALPVLEEVIVVLPNGQETVGLVKTYIPFPLTYDEFYAARDKGLIEIFWDNHINNFRKDEDGKIWLIDTQVDPISIT